MNIINTTIEGLVLIEPKIWQDDRGYFFESYNKKSFADINIHAEFVQDNQSLSQIGTLRGLHAQAPPFEQGKLVRVMQGAVIDVAVDIRKNSPTYGQYVAVELTAENFRMFWIPPGFAHGFVTLRDNTIFTYKVSGLYNKESEIGIKWNDADLNIDWGISADKVLLSEKDKMLPSFKDFESPF